MPQYVVELYVVDFVARFRMEALVDECEFSFARLKPEVIKDRAEASHRDEAGRRLVLVLVEWLNEQAAVAHFGT